MLSLAQKKVISSASTFGSDDYFCYFADRTSGEIIVENNCSNSLRI
jgi:hypothetical protein